MAKNSKRIMAAIETALGDLQALDYLPPLKSIALTIFFDPGGDYTNITPRFDIRTKKANLTAVPEPSP